MSDMKIANQLYWLSQMGMETAEIVLPRVKDEDLKAQIDKRCENFRRFRNRSREILKRDGKSPDGGRKIRRRFLRGYVGLGTFLNKSPQHILRILIGETAIGILKIRRAVSRGSNDTPESVRLAEDYLIREQQSIDRMSGFL